MKKLIFIGVLGLFALGSCNSKKTGHEGHDHETVTHNHDEHEGHEHETEGHDHEAEGADHSHEGECSGGHDHDKDAGKSSKAAGEHSEPAGEHSDEIILPKAKADAAGVKVSTITPAPFQQVIKTSGHGSRSRFFPWKSDGRNERWPRHSADYHFFAQHRRR